MRFCELSAIAALAEGIANFVPQYRNMFRHLLSSINTEEIEYR